jgi:hypothetical protein
MAGWTHGRVPEPGCAYRSTGCEQAEIECGGVGIRGARTGREGDGCLGDGFEEVWRRVVGLESRQSRRGKFGLPESSVRNEEPWENCWAGRVSPGRGGGRRSGGLMGKNSGSAPARWPPLTRFALVLPLRRRLSSRTSTFDQLEYSLRKFRMKGSCIGENFEYSLN